VTDTWNVIQKDFSCCGVDSFDDWKNTAFSGGNNLPDSCCKDWTKDCGKSFFNNPDVSKINEKGCYKLLETEIVDNVEVVGGVAIGILVVQVNKFVINITSLQEYSCRCSWCWCPACWPTT